MLHFMDCNSKIRFDFEIMNDSEISEEMMQKQLNESIESGLIADREAGIFIRDGYGALVGFCPENCSTIEDVLKFTLLDWNRKTAGKPTLKEKIREIIKGNNFPFDPYYEYQELVDEGYDLVLGLGCAVYGQQWGKAVYCRNYDEILEKSKSNGKAKLSKEKIKGK